MAGTWPTFRWAGPAGARCRSPSWRRGRSASLTDYLALRPVLRYGMMAVSVASIALNLVLENLVRFFFGSGFRSYEHPDRAGLELSARSGWGRSWSRRW